MKNSYKFKIYRIYDPKLREM